MTSEGQGDAVTTNAPTVSVVGEAAIRTQPDEAFLSDMHVDAGQQEVTASIHATFRLDLT